MTVKFGGLDMAMRVDNSALIVLKLEDGVLEQIGQKVWPHISLDKVAADMLKIQRIEKMKAIGYDRLGIGDGARQLFSKEVPLRDIISSQTNKLAMIGLVKGLFTQEKLIVHDKDLFREILEQEKKISDAGNILLCLLGCIIFSLRDTKTYGGQDEYETSAIGFAGRLGTGKTTKEYLEY